MGRVGGTQYARDSQREVRRRRMRAISYVLLGVLAAATVGVVLLALQR